MSQIQEQLNNLKISYESDANASFLVIQCDGKIIEYQSEMIGLNRIKHVIPTETIKKEDKNYFYFNITSKISLSLYLKRSHLNRVEFLKLLLQIISVVIESSGYLLNTSNFLFHMEYLFICPETQELSLVYIPSSIGRQGSENLQIFISELLMQHIHIEEFDCGNLVQRILSAVKSDTFHLKSFKTLLTDLLYGQQTSNTELKQDSSTIRQTLQTNVNFIEKKEENKKEKTNKGFNGKHAPLVTIFAVLLQVIMGGTIYLCREFLDNAGKNPAATYAAVIMIVLAIDVLIFKKIIDNKLINMQLIDKNTPVGLVKDEMLQDDPSVQKIMNTTINDQMQIREPSKDLNYNPKQFVGEIGLERVINEMEDSKHEFMRNACKTELLGSYSKGIRLLRSTGKHPGDKDIILDKDDFIIGRLSGHVDHVLYNNAVGKVHAEFVNKNGSCFIKDLNTMNGTYINNKRIESNKEIELKENDKIQLANSEFVLINC